MAGGSVGMAHAPAGDALARAHAALLRQADLQFDFAQMTPPAPPPNWLLDLLKWLGHLGPVFKWLFWIGLAVAALAILAFLGRELLASRFPSFKRKPKPAPAPEWRPAPARARTLLEDADRLAAAGDYAGAAHLLLHRSIQDIEVRRPRLVRPAFTAREIALLDDLPEAARATFSHIAEVVERSFFGGREVDAAGFAECRRAYESFAFPGAWA